MLRLRDATNTLRVLRAMRVRDATNTLRQVRRMRVRDATNTLRQVYQAVTITLTDKAVSRNSPTSAPTTSYNLHTDGKAYQNGLGLLLETWCSDALFVGDYEAHASITSGTGVTNTGLWLPLSVSRSFSLTDTTHDDVPKTATIFVEIREAATGTVVDSATISMSANFTIGGP